ncbi:hypothetical protein BMS3Abin02_01934 [bacterium BMS3Abin02]|nr:hypothetical protein BMS3Abin02_01934 [bacterium BMS3Abin02]GBE22062.1 hypothetical protein BMS3Bbin01_01424 [bacterium BMS3Bbin01]HDH26837.1 hypothetical protein [Actinomycetota bacterium]HDK45263.1 hypothetical protein [Actinomycetota bacterium]HDL48487.1 hypothetical protein [Actinomycetota bacterium]
MSGLVSLNETIALLVLAVGLAMVFGNGLALVKGSRGEGPDGQTLYAGRAWFLLVAGVVITIWAVASLIG